MVIKFTTVLFSILLMLSLYPLIQHRAVRGFWACLCGIWAFAVIYSITGEGYYLWLIGAGIVFALFVMGLYGKRDEKEREESKRQMGELEERDRIRKEEFHSGDPTEDRWRFSASGHLDAVVIGFELNEPVQFGKIENGSICFPVGKNEVVIRLRICEGDEDGEPLAVQTIVKSESGDLWMADTVIQFGDLLENVLDSDRGASGNEIYSWKTAPEEWKSALQKNCLADGGSDMLDSRMYYALKIDGTTYQVREKYLSPRVSVSWVPEGRVFVALVEDMTAFSESDPFTNVPPFLFSLPPGKLLLPCISALHWNVKDEWLENNLESKANIEFSFVESDHGISLGSVVMDLD